MDPHAFLRDLELLPHTLSSLSTQPSVDTWRTVVEATTPRLVLVGMGSSHFANCALAARLQAAGLHAYAVLASADPLPGVRSDDTVIVVSASGTSVETVAAAEHYAGRCRTIALTNVESSPVRDLADFHVDMRAGVEAGGVSCRSFSHTLALHLALVDALTGTTTSSWVTERAAEAAAHLLTSREVWLDEAADLLLGPDGTAVVAPARRLSSAQQSALMLREGPRLAAIACETGDWSHIDVYLTKTKDYRMLLMRGSAWEEPLMRWCRERASTVVALGTGQQPGELDGTSLALRYPHDDMDDVALVVEHLVTSLLAQRTWALQVEGAAS